MSLKLKVFLALTTCIALVDIFYVLLNINLANQSFDNTLKQEAKVLQSSYDLLMSRQEENMLTIATFIANDPKITAAFKLAKDAIKKEGGGAGKAESQQLRKKLYEKIAPAWQEVQKEFSARQLHFHLGPGSTSFLRVHKPEKFGDNMDDVRHTVVDVNRHLQPVSGFETGRVYSGIRGVVPVFYQQTSTDNQEHIGALEVGTSFNSVLSLMDKEFDIGAAVFLTKKHVDDTIWPEAIKQREETKYSTCDCYLEATTRQNIEEIVEVKGNKILFTEKGVKHIVINEENLALAYFPLRDYLGEQQLGRDNVGAVVFWKNIDPQVTALEKTIHYNIIAGIFGFLIVEIFIFFAVRLAVHSLEKTVKAQASSLLTSNWELNLSNKLIKNLKEGILVTDTKANIIRVNQAICDITGYSEQELIGNTPRQFSSGKQSFNFYKQLWKTLTTEDFWKGEIWNRRKSGEIYAESLAITAVKDESGMVRNYVAVCSDITIQKEKQVYLENAAFTDPLTKLPNRLLLQDRLSQAIRHSQRNKQVIACIFIDLDNFKPVNDTYGHDAGDFLLVAVSQRMQEEIRTEDTLARIGGDEFVIVVSDLNSPEQCIKLVQRLITTVNKPVPYNEHLLKVSASVGIATYDANSDDINPEELLRQADEAMYKAKCSGKNSYSYYQKSAQ